MTDWAEPEEVFARLFASRAEAFWLDAGEQAQEGWSYLGAAGPLAVVALSFPSARGGGEVELRRPGTGESSRIASSLLELLDRGSVPARPDGEDRGPGDHAPPFQLGWVGWIGYETGAAALGVPVAADAGPDSALIYADRLVAFDHERRRIQVSALILAGEHEHAQREWLERACSRLAGPALSPVRSPAPLAPPRLLHGREEYLRLIESCRERIRHGDAYQLCLTNRFRACTSEEPFSVYRRLRAVNPSPHGGFLTVGGTTLLSSSPESFLSLGPDRRARTRPIKGTRRRGRDAEEDRRLRRELAQDPKERAENVMIVDLMRNDLGQVAVLGSVRVEELFAVEAYRNVLQLVSTVSARLAPEASAGQLVRAAFPAGSMTGAPKLSAMRLLHELESAPRGAYAGAFGFVSRTGALQLSMTIRSIVLRDGRAEVGAGGGITALSDPAFEFEETLLKAAPLLAALGSPLSPGSADRIG